MRANATTDNPVLRGFEETDRRRRQAGRVRLPNGFHSIRGPAAAFGRDLSGQRRGGTARGQSGATPPRGDTPEPSAAGGVCIPGHFGQDNPDVHTGTAYRCQSPGGRTGEGAV